MTVQKNVGLYWKDWNDTIYEAYIEIILHSFCCLIISILTIFWIYTMYCKNRNKSVMNASIENRFHKYLSASLVISWIYIYWAFYFNVLSVLVIGWRPNYGCFYRQLVVIPVALQRLIIYYFYVLRLHASFNGSIAQLSKKWIYIFIITVTINIIGASIFLLIATYLMNMDDNSFICGRTRLRIVLLWIIFFSDTLWSIIFSSVYIKKLIQVFKLVSITNEKRIYVVKRLSVLAITSVVSSHSLLIIFTITDGYFTYQLTSMDSIVNNICIMLSFKEFDRFYENLCCCYNNCCHSQKQLSGYIENSQIVKNQKINPNNNIGEPTAMTCIETTNKTITVTANEGRQRIPSSNTNDNITPGFEINNIELTNDISFTSKIRDKNDSIIQKNLAFNEIALYQTTQQ